MVKAFSSPLSHSYLVMNKPILSIAVCLPNWRSTLLAIGFMLPFLISNSWAQKSTYNGLPCYFGGKTGKVRLVNSSPYTAYVSVWHPDSNAIFRTIQVPGSSTQIPDVVLGDDWGIQIGSSPVRCLGSIASSGDSHAPFTINLASAPAYNPLPISCPQGSQWNGTACLPSTSPTCPVGSQWNGSACLPTASPSCPNGTQWNGSACLPAASPSCPNGTQWNGASCSTNSASTTCSPSDSFLSCMIKTLAR